MTVVVATTRNNSISITQGSRSESAVVIKKSGSVTVQGLSNVNSTDLQDGYTLVYDSTTNTWITQQLSGEVLSSVDGGTY